MRAAGGFYAPCFRRTKGLVDLPHMLTSLVKLGLLNRAIPTRSKGKQHVKAYYKVHTCADYTHTVTDNLSLSVSCGLMLGKGINKRTQLSDWSRRPLSGKQLHYAALDAHCELAILGRCLQELYARSGTPVEASLLPLIALADEYVAQGTSEVIEEAEADGAGERELIEADKVNTEIPSVLPILSEADSPDTVIFR